MKKAFSKRFKEALSNLLLTFSEVSTDKGVLAYDTEELEIGATAEMVSEDGEKTTAEDGDYALEDGTIIKVADGKISEIVAPKEEEVVEPEPAKEEEPESLEEEEEKPVVEEEKPEEVKEPEEPETPEVNPMDDVLKAISALEETIVKLEERIAALENAPAAQPIAEEFTKAVKSENTKDSHMEFMKKMATARK